MRILMLTQWFQPEPFFKGLPLARALRDRGHEVEVLTGFPNYPGGRLYRGYRQRPWLREELDGICVNRLPLYLSHDRNAFRRMANYLSFGASAGIIGPWLVKSPDVVYVYNLITLGPAARLLRWLKGCRIVLDVQDLWPESVTGSGMMANRTLHRLLKRWCQVEYQGPDQIVVLSSGFKRHLVARGVPEDRIEVIPNWCDEDAIRPQPGHANLAETLGFTGRFNIVFAGTMGIVQAMDSVIDAARRLLDPAPEVLFTFVGDGIEVNRLKALAANLSNVRFLPRRPMSEIGPILSIADAVLVHLKTDPIFEITIPSKIQAYLHAGRPILCGVKGDAAELVKQARAGIVFVPENPASLVNAVMELRSLGSERLRMMGDSGRRFYQENLSMEKGVIHLETLFASLKAA